MMHCNKSIRQKNNRLCNTRNLLFFVLLAIFSCKDAVTDVTLIWDNSSAKAARIPGKLVTGIPNDSIKQYLHIRAAKDTSATNILGEYVIGGDIVFMPLVPFLHGAEYAVFVKDKQVAQFKVSLAGINDIPEVITCYPQVDTVPENLLKIYIEFSHPMSEGQSGKYIKLIKNGKDTLQDVFLDLQPELWNEDRTVLTVWLDPGRIKRDLQPNLRLGNPLQPNEKYTLLVSRQWKDAQGAELKESFTKKFVVSGRDSLSPDPAQWKILLPKPLSKDPVMVESQKPLDHFLLLESLNIKDKIGAVIKGHAEVDEKDKTWFFFPDKPWDEGMYTLLIASKLEDLAGNNLNRPFERDITKTKQPSTKEQYSKSFKIE